jgi:methionyl-tRNA formyltransferase
MKIIFMGTPEFALPTITHIYNSGHEIIAVYSQPPREAGRGLALKKSPVHLFAEEKNIKVFTPINFKNSCDVEDFKNLNADVAVVAAYGLLLPKGILEGTKLGCINLHPSLLPRWRGAAPIQRPIMAGDSETGICIMKMDIGLDTGDVILRKNIPLPISATAGQMHDMLAERGGEMIVDALNLIERGEAKFTPQSDDGVTYAKKILKEEARLNFNENILDVYNKVRGLSPFPGSFFELNGARIKIFKAEFTEENHNKIGEVELSKDSMKIYCEGGILFPKIIQKEGKKQIAIEEFLRGI